MTLTITLITIGVVLLLLIGLFIAFAYTKAKPDEAILISGCGKRKILIGKAGWRIPFLQRKDRLSLKSFQVDIKTKEAIPTNEFINIMVDGVANLKISSNTELLERAFETILGMTEENLIAQVKQVLEGNMREIVGTVGIRQLVQNRKDVAQQVQENVIPDMQKLGIELVNFNIQSFSDENDVIKNLGIDNISQISKDASIAKANAKRDVEIAEAKAAEEANKAKVVANTEIIKRNTDFSMTQSELKTKTDTAKAAADAAYSIEEQKRTEDINIACVNAEIAKKEREVELGNKEVELKERQLEAEINKKADAEKYAAQQTADAELYKRKKAAEAKKYELAQEAEMQKIQAEAEKVAKEKAAEALKIQANAEAAAQVAKANAAKEAAFAEAKGIEAKGKAEAEAILKKAEAMKQYGDAATLQLILESNVLPEIIKAYSEPMASAYGKIGNITVFGDGTGKLAEGITNDGLQIAEGIKNATGIDVKSLLTGVLGTKMFDAIKKNPSDNPTEE